MRFDIASSVAISQRLSSLQLRQLSEVKISVYCCQRKVEVNDVDTSMLGRVQTAMSRTRQDAVDGAFVLGRHVQATVQHVDLWTAAPLQAKKCNVNDFAFHRKGPCPVARASAHSSGKP